MAIFNSQMFYLGQLADVDPSEGGNGSENALDLIGLYSQPPLTNIDVNDVSPDGVIPDNENGSTSENFTYDTGAGSISQFLDSTQTYMAQVQLGDGSFSSMQVTVIQMENGDVFLTDYGNNGSIDNLAIQTIELTSLTGANYNGFWANSSVDNSSVVCFTPGALIETDHGPVPVEDLRTGHFVRTLDHGYQPVHWVVHRTVEAPELAANPHLRPIIIRKGALGNARRMRTSPQHGFLVHDRFIRAKHLAEYFGGKVASVDRESDCVTYVNFLCDKHEIVFVDGCAAESLYPGPLALQTIGREAFMELSTLFPDLLNVMPGREEINSIYGRPARSYMTAREVRQWKSSRPHQQELVPTSKASLPKFNPGPCRSPKLINSVMAPSSGSIA